MNHERIPVQSIQYWKQNRMIKQNFVKILQGCRLLRTFRRFYFHHLFILNYEARNINFFLFTINEINSFWLKEMFWFFNNNCSQNPSFFATKLVTHKRCLRITKLYSFINGVDEVFTSNKRTRDFG